MPTPVDSTHEPGRRKTLALIVNSAVAVIGGAFSALVGVFARRVRRRARPAERWVRAGTLGDLTPNVPVPRVSSVPRADGWYRERARETVFRPAWRAGGQGLLRNVHPPWVPGALGRRREEVPLPLSRRRLRRFRTGARRSAPRPLSTIDARVEGAEESVLVRV